MAAENEHYIDGLDKMSKVIQEERLIKNEVECKSFFLSKIKKKAWDGCGRYDIPFQLSSAGTITMEECLPEDPYKGSYDKGFCDKLAKISLSLCADEDHLRCYKKMDKESYIDLIGNSLETGSRRMISYVDRMIMLDNTIAEVTANTTTLGGTVQPGDVTTGDNPEPGALFIKSACVKEFERGRKYEICSDNFPTPLTVWVSKVNNIDNYVTFQTNAPDGTAPVPAVLAVYDVSSDDVRIKPAGHTAAAECGNSFGSIDNCLGFDGSTTIHGINRDASPMLAGELYDISTSDGASILKDLSGVFAEMMEQCNSSENVEVMVSYAFFNFLSIELQHAKQYVQPVTGGTGTSDKAKFGYHGLCFASPNGGLVTIRAVPKMREDCAYIIDYSTFTWLGDSTWTDPHSPMAGQPKWYRERGCGYRYFRDVYFRGKLLCLLPCANAKIDVGLNWKNC